MLTHSHIPVHTLTYPCTHICRYSHTFLHTLKFTATPMLTHRCTHTLGLWDVCLRGIFIPIIPLSFPVFNPNYPIMVIITVHWAPLCSRSYTSCSLYNIPKAHKKSTGQVLRSHFIDVVTGPQTAYGSPQGPCDSQVAFKPKSVCFRSLSSLI